MPRPQSEHSHPALTQPELRRLSVAAECDPKTIIRYLRDKPQVATSRERIERALRTEGFPHLIRARSRQASAPPSSST